MIVDPWFDYLNALFRLSNIPIRADLADVFLLDRPMEGTGDSMINSMGRDRLLRHFMNRTGAHEVILVTKRNQPAGRCGLHNGGDRTGLFKPFGWVARLSFGCALWGAEGKRTFAHEIGHGMGLDHTAAEGVMTGQPAYASAGETSSWGTIMKTPKWFGWTRKDTFSDMNRKCDKSTTCGGSNKADAARYLRETLFKYTPIPVVQFKSKTNGQCLDIRGGVKNGNALMTQACSGSVSQQFRWVDNGAIVVDGLCLEVKGGVDAQKTAVVVNPCDGGDKQRWMESGGRILSWNGSAGRCLDLATEAKNAVQMWTCHPSSPDQRFAKVPK